MERLKNKRRIYKCKRKFRVRHLTLTWEYCTMQKTNMKYKFLFVTVGTALATAACGGYIIIATGLLIAAATGELVGRKTVIPSFTHFRFFDHYGEKFHVRSMNSYALSTITRDLAYSLIVALFRLLKVFFLFYETCPSATTILSRISVLFGEHTYKFKNLTT